MPARTIWKGFIKVAELSCAVGLYTAASTSERIAFHTLNRKTGNRVRRQFVDSETGKPVESDDQVKGYEAGDGRTIMLEPEEIAAAIPDSDKTLSVDSFLACDAIDDVYFDRPYYLAPTDAVAAEAFVLLREGMIRKKSAALARAVLFRRLRTVLIRPAEGGMVATTLKFDYEVRSAAEAFADIPKLKIKGEMLDLARHIIDTKAGSFDPAAFDDRYESALADLVRAKIDGKPLKPRKPAAAAKVIDLMDALRASAKASAKAEPAKPAAKGKPAAAGPRRKAS